MDDMESIRRAGAAARRAGTPLLENPYYETDALPIVTGEDVYAWARKAQAWEDGWRGDVDPPATGAGKTC